MEKNFLNAQKLYKISVYLGHRSNTSNPPGMIYQETKKALHT